MVYRMKYSVVKIRRKPWHIWLLRLIWLVWLIFWADVAIGSRKELEPRAFTIALIVFLVSLFIGFIVWVIGLRKFKLEKD